MIEEYLRIPYLRGGRTESGCDCWGFVRLIIGREKGVELPSYDGVDETDVAGIERCYERLSAPRDWCLVLMEQRRGHAHVGVFLDGCILHMTQCGASLVPFSRLRCEVKGYYGCTGRGS
nr:MAG TPA: NlpC/P60 family [Bacteriophage sp.]